MKPPPVLTLRTCRACGAENFPEAPQCWLCKEPLPAADEIVTAEVVAPRRAASPVGEWLSLAALILCFALFVLVGVGIAFQSPPLAVVYFLLACPAALAMLIREHNQRARQGQQTWSDRLATAAVSFSLTLAAAGAICVALVAAGVVALFVMCFSELAR